MVSSIGKPAFNQVILDWIAKKKPPEGEEIHKVLAPEILRSIVLLSGERSYVTANVSKAWQAATDADHFLSITAELLVKERCCTPDEWRQLVSQTDPREKRELVKH